MTLHFFFSLNHVELDTSVVFSILFAADRRRDRVVSAGERAHIGGYISRGIIGLEQFSLWNHMSVGRRSGMRKCRVNVT